MTRPRILVVDDKENMRNLFVRLLSDDYDVSVVSDGAHAIAKLSNAVFDLVVTDVRMPGADGFEVLRAIKQSSPDTEVVLVTAYATVNSAVEAIKEGAYDYLEKPFDPDVALRVIGRAIERKQLREQAADLLRVLEQRNRFHSLVGASQPMRQLFALLEKAARTDVTVLLTGESGTGKELAARAIHDESRRKSGKFVPVNCGAIPDELIESELFGHARGSFTGAAARTGLFEEANKGTLFLDEIGELPASAQVKLNRALQEHEVRRVGENRAMHVDVRIIAATNRNLKAEVERGGFREDLYYRLHVFSIVLPPLRERGDDIRLLAAHCLEQCARRLGVEVDGIAPEALRALLGHDWPGNVRELENTIERAVAVAAGPNIELSDLPPDLAARPKLRSAATALLELNYRDMLKTARDDASHEYLAGLMAKYHGNVTRAADHAGIERESLHRLLKKHGLRATDFREPDSD